MRAGLRRRDVAFACLIGALLMAGVEYGLAVWTFPEALDRSVLLRLAALTIVLAMGFGALTALACATAMTGYRVLARWRQPSSRAGEAHHGEAPRTTMPSGSPRTGPVGPVAGAGLAALGCMGTALVTHHYVTYYFKEPILGALVVGTAVAVAVGLAASFVAGARAHQCARQVASVGRGGQQIVRPASAAPANRHQLHPAVAFGWAGLTLGALALAVTAAVLLRWPQQPLVMAGIVGGVAVLAMWQLPGLTTLFVAAADACHPLGAANPLGRRRAALLAMLASTAGLGLIAQRVLPQARAVFAGRDRLFVSVAVFTIGLAYALAHLQQRRAATASVPGRRFGRWAAAASVAALAFLTLSVHTLRVWGADQRTKYAAMTASPALQRGIAVVRRLSDVDGDGFSSLLGEQDCAPWNAQIHPLARDLPGNGIDENCNGRDGVVAPAPAADGSQQVPAPFDRRDWNFLLITIDTVRYDRTTFGGYAQRSKRDTTPHLAAFAERAISFAFAQAPSAGTMASIPAIITSKFFHSGIALDETIKPGNPPKIKPENTTLFEVMQRGGYRTGVIASHEYWNNWGLDQGVDVYDNSIGAKPDPFRVVADQVTNRTLAFIANQRDKWCLWAHYIDPHGRYVAHPDVVDWGGSEPDLYDAELRWTDQEVGRLLAELARMPHADRTIVIITSDHGDSMGEHNIPVGTHGSALYRELLHVPFLIYVPDAPPRKISSAVSNLDVLPTMAALAGIDISDLAIEGRSLVPEVFFGREDRARMVFAETNYPDVQRAAISADYKLIYRLHANLYEFYDLRQDPEETRNRASEASPELTTYKNALNDWLERVMYARDREFNQAARKFESLLAQPPTPTHPASLTLADDAITVLGFDVDATPTTAGRADSTLRLRATVYFAARANPPAVRFGLVIQDRGQPANLTRTGARPAGKGLLPTERWRAGEYFKETFELVVPASTQGWRLGLEVVPATVAPRRGQAPSQGSPPWLANEPNTQLLGDFVAQPETTESTPPQGSPNPPKP